MLHLLAFILCRIFFKRISISGTAYIGKSAIWVANHSSGIVDPTVLIGLAPIQNLRPLAKESLWAIPVLREFLQLLRAIPVSRLQDIKKDLQAQKNVLKRGELDPNWRMKVNNDAFLAVSESLIRGDSILIFPEGLSHDEPYLYPFKTGVARMALQAVSRGIDKNFQVIIQPVVIDYSEKDEFRSELCLHYCEPIAVTSDEYSVDDIMDGIRQSMENGFPSFLTWDEKRNWRFLFEVSYGRISHSAREFRLFVVKFREYFEADFVLMAKVQTMRRMLQALNISPLQLVWGEMNYKKRNFFWVIFAQGWFYLFVIIPIELLGLIVWVTPAKICEYLATVSTADRDVRATMKIAHGMWVFPLWAFLMSSLFSLLFDDYLPYINSIVVWFGFQILTPVFLILSLILTESMEFFPGFFRLARLRFFFPRGWLEMTREWREVSESILYKVKQMEDSEKNFGKL